ncbi:indole-3-glycerol phosphate synthase [Amphibacillus marinus]|uniref:Indole-3-glycerol phosphate synthase n=1 Tax=Amphibacillus marinus TaxID=872970 RepID=A0A1H8TXY4_9BACI|nr:indole-3-glycerol phosphate synthase TrpC [Amphibacillus marinus]SEO95454.1 indole-3-glycerol phosphate synthase [Amphibacillus marinus]
MTILEEIINKKQIEVVQIKQQLFDHQTRAVPVRSFIELCRANDKISIIAEFKRASPSKGLINLSLDPGQQAAAYAKAGASMISVLTDEPFFKGSIADLIAARKAVDLPILNKDFIIDESQIDRAYIYGADVILLIAAALPEQRLQELYQYATGLGLEVLLEVHNELELQQANQMGAILIGVNNRNLKTFHVDLATTERLARLIDHSKQVLVSESGLKTVEDVRRVTQAGAKAVLIGETMMQAVDLNRTFSQFTKAGDSDAG